MIGQRVVVQIAKERALGGRGRREGGGEGGLGFILCRAARGLRVLYAAILLLPISLGCAVVCGGMGSGSWYAHFLLSRGFCGRFVSRGTRCRSEGGLMMVFVVTEENVIRALEALLIS